MAIIHLCNYIENQPSGWKNISSYEQFGYIESSEDDIWLINVSLSWNNHALTSFYGFSIATAIRTEKKSKAPVIFYSPIEKEFFERKSENEIKYKILFGRGSALIESPFKEQELTELAMTIPALSNAALHDVSVASCNLKGVVIEKLKHDLKFEQGELAVTRAIKSISYYLSESQKTAIWLNFYLTELENKINKNDRPGFEKERDLFVSRCEKYLTDSKLEIGTSINKIQHTVIAVDDDEEFLQYVVNNLSDSFIVIPFESAENAWKYLQTDDGLKVTAIISDWRLYNGRYMQQMQGYELLEHAGRVGFRALFSLSMQAEFLVHQIRNKISVRFTMYKKDNLEEPGQWRAFKDLLHQACTETNQIIAAIPKKESWTKPQRKGKPSYYEEYLEKRNSTGWGSFENGISEASNLIWCDYYWKYLNDRLDESLQDFSKRFGLPLNTIEAILIARRICLALYFRQNYKPKRFYGEENPKINVYTILRNKDFDEEVEINRVEFGDEKIDKDGKRYSIEEWTKKLLNGTATTLLNTELGFNLDEIVSFRGVFPEEKNWLNRNGIEFSLQYVDAAPLEIEDTFNELSEKELEEIDNLLRKGETFSDDEEIDNFA